MLITITLPILFYIILLLCSNFDNTSCFLSNKRIYLNNIKVNNQYHLTTYRKINLKKTSYLLFNSINESIDDKEVAISNSIQWDYNILLFVLPLLSIIFPLLLNQIVDSNTTTTNRSIEIISLLITKRIYLYSVAYVIIDLIAKRSINLSTNLSKRFQSINNEIIISLTLTNNTNNNINSLNKELDVAYDMIDNVPIIGQILIIPVLLIISLLISYSLIQNNVVETNSLVNIFTSFSLVSSIAVCGLFANVELKEYFKSINLSFKKDLLPVISAILLTISSFISPICLIVWPVHNIINGFIAINVSRVLQFSKLQWIILLLSLLVVYDYTFTNSGQILTDGGKSIMEAIATNKLAISPNANTATSLNPDSITSAINPSILSGLSFSNWKPGIFEISINNRVTDGLGLGDVVFPGILGGWCLRYDKQLYKIFTYGYIAGCLLCEVFQTANGQPALLFIVPSCFLAIIIEGLRKNNLQNMFKFGDDVDDIANN